VVSAFDAHDTVAGDGEAGVYSEDDEGVCVRLSCAKSKGQAAASTRY